MHIAVDLDDVIADLLPHLVDTHFRMTGQKKDPAAVRRWEEFPAAVQDQVKYGGEYALLQPIPGAFEFLSWLRQVHEVSIVTYRGKHAKSITMEWLEKHVPGTYDGVFFTGGSKVDMCRELGVGLIIDDSYNQIPAVTAALNIPGILMDTPMNRHIVETDLIFRASNLAEARELIVTLTAPESQ